jgi:hypothetical protein
MDAAMIGLVSRIRAGFMPLLLLLGFRTSVVAVIRISWARYPGFMMRVLVSCVMWMKHTV